MAWLILLVVIVIAAFAIPKFGKSLLIFLGIVLVLILVGVVLLYESNRRQQAEHSESDRRQQAEREVAKTRIKPSDVELVDLLLQPVYPEYSVSSYMLRGRVRNRSRQYTLSELRLKLVMRDCTASSACETVGETEEVLYVNIPPGQARDFVEFVDFKGLHRLRGKHQWDYQIIEILGR